MRPRLARPSPTTPSHAHRRCGCASGTLLSQWQAAAILDRGGRPFRCRELVHASLMSAFAQARSELRAFPGPGVIVVTGSLHAVAEALKLEELQGLVVA